LLSEEEYRPLVRIKNVESFGFIKDGFIPRRAAYNIKQQVDCIIDGAKVYQCQIAFRVRGPVESAGAHVKILNCIAYDNEIIVRAENKIQQLKIYNCTFNKKAVNDKYIVMASGGADLSGLDILNCLFVGTKPPIVSHKSNLIADKGFFLNMENHDYRIVKNCPAVNAGINIEEVITDYSGITRKMNQYDVGAYEFKD
jgi:hypothetical protein